MQPTCEPAGGSTPCGRPLPHTACPPPQFALCCPAFRPSTSRHVSQASFTPNCVSRPQPTPVLFWLSHPSLACSVERARALNRPPLLGPS